VNRDRFGDGFPLFDRREGSFGRNDFVVNDVVIFLSFCSSVRDERLVSLGEFDDGGRGIGSEGSSGRGGREVCRELLSESQGVFRRGFGEVESSEGFSVFASSSVGY